MSRKKYPEIRGGHEAVLPTPEGDILLTVLKAEEERGVALVGWNETDPTTGDVRPRETEMRLSRLRPRERETRP